MHLNGESGLGVLRPTEENEFTQLSKCFVQSIAPGLGAMVEPRMYYLSTLNDK